MRSVRTSLRTKFSIVGLGLATVAATAVGATAQAAPSAPVQYSAKLVGKTVQIDITNGTVAVDGQNLLVKNSAGAPVFSYPLTYGMESRKFPIAAKVAGNRATLIPQTNVAKSTKLAPTDVAQLRTQVKCDKIRGPQTKQERDDQALSRFTGQLTAAVGVGTLVGMIIGGAVGLVGLALGPVALATVPTFAAVGAVVGTIASGAPVIQYWNQYNATINSPFRYLCY